MSVRKCNGTSPDGAGGQWLWCVNAWMEGYEERKQDQDQVFFKAEAMNEVDAEHDRATPRRRQNKVYSEQANGRKGGGERES